MTPKTVTIERWYSQDGKTFWYWIVDENNEGIDGFSKKSQALDAISRWSLVRTNKSIKDKF